MAKFEVKNNEIKIDKEITKLDEFVLSTLAIVKKYANYAIIGGYIAIFFGRARATEDIDIFLEKIDFQKFSKMADDFHSKGFELTVENKKSLYYEYLEKAVPISVWRKNFPLLRLEMKFALKPSQKEVLENPISIKFMDKKLLFGPLESQIAYKRYILKSEKDLEDARHLELVFEGINQDLIKKYKKQFEYEMDHGK